MSPPASALLAPAADATEARRRLYEEQADFVWTVLRRLGLARADLEDLTHEVFVRALRDWGRLDPQRGVRPWLVGIAHHVAVDFRRRQQHRAISDRAPATEQEQAAHGPTPEVAAERAQELRILAALLDALSLERRTVLVLHELYGHSVPELADLLGLPLNTAYSRLRLARRDFEARVRRWKGGR